jgi:hydrogenase nickel incorporation protein HypA/HybF
MHELSVASALIDTALRHAEDRPVSTVAVRVGALRQVVPESLRFYWEIVSRDTVCEGATLTLEEIALELACEDCGRRWSPEIPAFRCPDCHSVAVTALAGEELDVEYIEVEEAEEELCTAPE